MIRSTNTLAYHRTRSETNNDIITFARLSSTTNAKKKPSISWNVNTSKHLRAVHSACRIHPFSAGATYCLQRTRIPPPGTHNSGCCFVLGFAEWSVSMKCFRRGCTQAMATREWALVQLCPSFCTGSTYGRSSTGVHSRRTSHHSNAGR